MDDAVLRDEMVDGLIDAAKGAVRTTRVADAMRAVPRHEFVPEEHRAYLDESFDHRGTRVLAPRDVGRLVEALDARPGDTTLVVGAGVGYTVAVVAELVGARNVHAVDISRELVYEARRNLERTGYGEVLVDCRDGADGLPAYAPYDRILLEAAAVDPPRRLRGQLADGGRLVMPRGTVDQRLVAVDREGVVEAFGPGDFAPLLVDGEQVGAVERNRTTREDVERAARNARARSGWEQDWIDWDARH